MGSHQAVQSFNDAAATLQTRLSSVGTAAQVAVTRAWVDGGTSMLLADYRYRQAERCEVFELRPGQATDARIAANRFNAAAIESFEQIVPAAARALGREAAELPARDPELLNANLDTFAAVMRDQVLAAELTAAQARVSRGILEDVEERARTGGAVGLCDLTVEVSERLAGLRRERPQHNDPVSAAIAALAAAAGAYVMFTCAPPGGPSCTAPGTVALIVLCFGVAIAFGAAAVAPAVY